jgi:hypothetical protein
MSQGDRMQPKVMGGGDHVAVAAVDFLEPRFRGGSVSCQGRPDAPGLVKESRRPDRIAGSPAWMDGYFFLPEAAFLSAMA